MYRRTSLKIVSFVIGAAILVAVAYFKKSKKDAAQQIYTVLERYRIPYDIDTRSTDHAADTKAVPAQGVEKCLQNIAYFTANNRPVNMLLVGFPFKSSNQEKKVIGALPDMAERKSLEYLQNILNEIKAVYKPGASILIFCDGIFFAEFFGITPDTVTQYEQALKALAADLPDISIFTAQDMLKANQLSSSDQLIQLIDTFEPSDAQFKAQLNSIPQTALKRFALELDHPQGRLLLKKHSLEDIVVRLLAREMRLRSYVAKEFPSPQFFRLTVHLSPDVSKKFGLRLSPTSEITPYHGVLVEEADGSWEIRFKKDIDMKQYHLESKLINGIPCGYFKR